MLLACVEFPRLLLQLAALPAGRDEQKRYLTDTLT
ncbi:hypothetical protein ADICEAN_01713 [Cesiribacter andamanensis AMV16]|uniref:Uncharacterized protein n=1 Tax=Cesiribacter andamanensis AMV16 TaxID=1279009 RepID=M7N7C9_9BACT|nr:hypothetical protein ADICEAN_01713 [Cesiribacter andamanensis AMV16]